MQYLIISLFIVLFSVVACAPTSTPFPILFPTTTSIQLPTSFPIPTPTPTITPTIPPTSTPTPTITPSPTNTLIPIPTPLSVCSIFDLMTNYPRPCIKPTATPIPPPTSIPTPTPVPTPTPTTYRGGFACTGSMEPAITCLDEATWEPDFIPEDIQVGTIISYTPRNARCNPNRYDYLDPQTGRLPQVSHRVTLIVAEGGYYKAKGDANQEEDGCLIPFNDIDAYIVKIHKNVRPENEAENEARKLRAERARENLARMIENYEQKVEAYNQGNSTIRRSRLHQLYCEIFHVQHFLSACPPWPNPFGED